MTTKKKQGDETAAADAPAASERATIDRPTVGRVIHYTNGDGDTYPAIVSRVDGDQMNLTHFDVMGPRMYLVQDIDAAARDNAGEPDTWTWPTRG